MEYTTKKFDMCIIDIQVSLHITILKNIESADFCPNTVSVQCMLSIPSIMMILTAICQIYMKMDMGRNISTT